MINNNNYYYYKKELSPDICKQIISVGNAAQEEVAIIGQYGSEQLKENELDLLKQKRNSNITWLGEQWLYDIIDHYVKNANQQAGWNLDVHWFESIQFTKYKLNQHYTWHQDCWEKVYGDEAHPNFRGKIRKLSCIISLSDPEDYKGGDLDFSFYNSPEEETSIHKCEEIKPQGSIVVFPSYTWHRVQPVTEGTRYSLVAWGLGNPYL